MFFIILLALTALSIAGSAAVFSVYGLANTFSGVFWSVVVMGGSLEAGKLIAASYLYRYWSKTGWLLKSYLFAGIATIMILTSTGIFGYLSTGYQTDILPLRQIESQLVLLEGEKARVLERKKEIDAQIANLPKNYVASRIKLMKEFDAEQKTLTSRVAAIDKEMLDLKQAQIKTEAHVGPITYIAKAFDLNTDDATKWLVFLIIFAFDPMAVALTLAVNIALRVRGEEKGAVKAVPLSAEPPEPVIKEVIKEIPVEKIVEKIVEVPVEKIVEKIVEVPASTGKSVQPKRHPRPYPGKLVSDGVSDERIAEIKEYYEHLNKKVRDGHPLTNDERWDMNAIKALLQRRGELED